MEKIKSMEVYKKTVNEINSADVNDQRFSLQQIHLMKVKMLSIITPLIGVLTNNDETGSNGIQNDEIE